MELPTVIVREITYTEPAVRGDTSGKVLKPAKINTGYELNVPLFCAIGDKIEIDTRTNEVPQPRQQLIPAASESQTFGLAFCLSFGDESAPDVC